MGRRPAGTAALGRPRPGHADAGFTLIEILVVVLLIGILYGLAVFTVGDRQYTETRESARRLHATLRLAMDESVIRGRPLALTLDDNGYAFAMLGDDGDWQPLDNERGLGRHRLAPVVRLEVLETDVPDVLAEREGDDDGEARGGLADEAEAEADEDADADAEPPRLRAVFLPTGEATAFRLRVHAEDERPDWLIEGGDDGEITLSRRD